MSFGGGEGGASESESKYNVDERLAESKRESGKEFGVVGSFFKGNSVGALRIISV